MRRGRRNAAAWTAALPARPGFLLPSEIPDTLFVGLEKALGLLNLSKGIWTPQ